MTERDTANRDGTGIDTDVDRQPATEQATADQHADHHSRTAPPDPPVDPHRQRDRRRAVIGAGGAIVLFVGICLLRSLSIKPFVAGDENQMVDYALRLWHGVAPGSLANTTVPELPGQTVGPQYVANHPPLYPYLVGGFLRLGEAMHHPTLFLYFVRFLTTLMGAGVLAFTAGVGFRLGGRHRVALATGGALVLGLIAPFVGIASVITNDPLATLFAIAVVYQVAGMLRLGLTWTRSGILVVYASLGMLSRVTNIVALAVAAGALVVVCALPWLFRGGGRDARGLRLRSGLTAAAVVVVPLLASGWFYLRNRTRYGDLIGSHMPGPVSAIPPHDSTVVLAAHPGFWFYMWSQLFGRFPTADPQAIHITEHWPLASGKTLYWPLYSTLFALALVLAALVVAAVRRSLGVRAARAKSSRTRVTVAAWWQQTRGGGTVSDLAVPLLWVVQALAILGGMAETASHFALGGSANARYIFVGLAGYALAMTVACLVFRRWAVVPLLLLLLCEAAGTWVIWQGVMTRPAIKLGQWLPQAVHLAMAANGVPHAGVVEVLIGVLALAGTVAAVLVFLRGDGTGPLLPRRRPDAG